MSRFTTTLAAVCLLTPSALLSQSYSYQKAVMFAEHGLAMEAKKELIGVAFNSATGSHEEMAKAYYMLGSIAVQEGQMAVARKRWTELRKKFPNSSEAKLAAKRTEEIAALMPTHSRNLVRNPVARAYLRNGDFWSKGKEELAIIDKKWAPRVLAAVKWYDRVIQEFPKTPAAESAGIAKTQTLLGWRGIDDSTKEGRMQADQYMARAVKSFTELAKAYPKSTALQALRFQIAQEYWRVRSYKDAESWLQHVIRSAGKTDDFFRDLATRWLKRMKY